MSFVRLFMDTGPIELISVVYKILVWWLFDRMSELRCSYKIGLFMKFSEDFR